MEIVVNQQSISLNLVWLRNNCRCPNCYNDKTHENKLGDVHVGIQVKNYSLQGENLHVEWNDDHLSEYNVHWIQSQQRPEIRPKVITWNGAEVAERISFIEAEQNELTEDKIAKLVNSLLQFGVSIVKNVIPSMEATEKICTQVGPVMNTFYGGMWQLDQEGFNTYMDTAYTNLSLEVHTDNTYAIEPAGVQVFHCIEPPKQGGETILVDGFKAAEMVKQQNEKYYDYLKTIPVEWHYNSNQFHFANAVPIINASKYTEDLEQIRYNTYHRSARIPFAKTSEMGSYYESVKVFRDILHKPHIEWNVSLRPGNVIFINNWRILHGRRQFTGRRKIIGCYLSMNSLLSKARSLKLIT